MKFLIFLTILVAFAMCGASRENSSPEDGEEPAKPPPKVDDAPPADHSHTSVFDPENCIIEPPPTNEELDEYFAWMDKNGVKWKDAHERKCKMVRCIYNMREIHEHNRRFELGLETFKRDLWIGSQFSHDEKMHEFVMQPPPEREFRSLPQLRTVLPNFPEPRREVNFIDEGLVSPALSQGSCGSCYAFSAITPLEAQVRKCGITNATLSIQSIVSCCTWGCWGCESGWAHLGYRWMARSAGVITEETFPYTSGRTKVAGECRYDKSQFVAMVKDYDRYDFGQAGNATFVQRLVSARGPVTAIFCVEDSLFSYKSGVYRSSKPCIQPMHAVAIVGYGTDPVQGDYWIVKNSWGPWWGDKGFFKIARGDNNCLIETAVSVPNVVKLDGTPCPP